MADAHRAEPIKLGVLMDYVMPDGEVRDDFVRPVELVFEDWLGEWTFLLNNGSMTDEPILWAHLMAKAGQTTAGVLVERSYIGQTYLLNFRRAAAHEGIRIVAEESIAQTGQDIAAAVRTL